MKFTDTLYVLPKFEARIVTDRDIFYINATSLDFRVCATYTHDGANFQGSVEATVVWRGPNSQEKLLRRKELKNSLEIKPSTGCADFEVAWNVPWNRRGLIDDQILYELYSNYSVDSVGNPESQLY